MLSLMVMEVNHDFAFDSLCPYDDGVRGSGTSVKEVYGCFQADHEVIREIDHLLRVSSTMR